MLRIARVQMGGDFKTKGVCMFKSQQYRAKEAECAELVKSSADAEESRNTGRLGGVRRAPWNRIKKAHR
jgi:hypothetical protein